MESTFVCSSCESRLPANAFSWSNRDSRSGKRYRVSQCKECKKRKTAEWRAANPERYREQGRRAKQRVRADPARYAHARKVENARRRAKTNRGTIVAAECKRCHEPFEYVFIQRSRELCDLCRRYVNDWRKFGLTGPEARDLRERGACDICGRNADPGGRFNEWHIDHCHDSGKIRGLLCSHCNTVLGLMAHDPARLRAAAAYLEA